VRSGQSMESLQTSQPEERGYDAVQHGA